jgi:diaminohydroxyphosphoribosylaminopyrimidine deaminase/5-amino-6-(5-phosphoribosylamino)uracil reductase
VSHLRALVSAICGPESAGDRDFALLQDACYAGLLGVGYTSPNPSVGALIVKDGEAIARGVHRICGREHAEAEALSRAKDRAKGADLYVSLEPCCHHGKQPPCVDAIIKAGVARVIYAGDDPDPRTCRRARPVLNKSGVKADGPLAPRAMVRWMAAWRSPAEIRSG